MKWLTITLRILLMKVWFGSFVYRISIFVGYLKPKPSLLKDFNDTVYFDLRPGKTCHSRLMHRKRVTCELHDSYFRLMTIKHAIPKIEWAIEWALNYYITQSRQEVRELELETRCGRESHARPKGPSGPPIELGSREVADKMQ